MTTYAATAEALVMRILDAFRAHPEAAEITDPWKLFKVDGFQCDDIAPSYAQAMWALNEAKIRYTSGAETVINGQAGGNESSGPGSGPATYDAARKEGGAATPSSPLLSALIAEAHAFADDTTLWLESEDGYFDIGLRLGMLRSTAISRPLGVTEAEAKRNAR